MGTTLTHDFPIALAVIFSKAVKLDNVEEPMHPAANVQFERAVREFAEWRAVPKEERSEAPAWWWGPAFELRGAQQQMPADWCASLELPEGASYADGAAVFLKSLADRTALPWHGDFPRQAKHSDPA
jgi:hypothetical protein